VGQSLALPDFFDLLSLKIKNQLALFLQQHPALQETWQRILQGLHQWQKVPLFEKEVLSRFSEEMLADIDFLNRLQKIFAAGSKQTDLFLKLATTYHHSYYAKKELLSLTASCLELIEKAKSQPHLLSLNHLSHYDAGGKEWLANRLIKLKNPPFYKASRETALNNRVYQVLFQSCPHLQELIEGKLLKNKLSSVEAQHILNILNIFREKSPSLISEKAPLLFKSFKKIHRQLGQDTFILVSNPSSYQKGSDAQTCLSFFQLLLKISPFANYVQTILKDFYSTEIDLTTALQNLKEYQNKLNQEKHPQRELAKLLQAFQGEEENSLVSYPLSQTELEKIGAEYQQVLLKGQELQKASMNELAQLIDNIQEKCRVRRLQQTQPNQGLISDAEKIELIAIARQALSIHFNIYPYDTQIFILLALLNHPSLYKGRIAQVKTGEGKSTLVALLTFYHACQGYFVDIITSSPYLARRDSQKYSDFFRLFNLTTSHICVEQPTQSHFNGQIIFGTRSDFQFALMREDVFDSRAMFSRRDQQLLPRPAEIVIVDEVDNLFMDSALSSARIALPRRIQLNWVYRPILEFVKGKKLSKPLEMSTGQYLALIQELKAYLTQRFQQEYSQYASYLSDGQLKIWLESAYQALYHIVENRDYVIKSAKEADARHKNSAAVIIVDQKNTGRLLEGCRWQRGLHEFLEAKHDLPIETESLTPASISTSVFFNSYAFVYGLTGTIGEDVERKELEATYQIDTFDAPPHRPNQRQIYPPKFIRVESEFFPSLLEDIRLMQQANRPTLILFETIEESAQFALYLKEQHIDHQTLNERQPTHEDFIIAQAGKSNKVLVATNTAGRGTDIALDPISLKNGGLHVIFAFYPENKRVEMQGFGRAGRQGQPGSGRMIVMIDQAMVEDPSAPDDEIEYSLLRKRKAQIEKYSNQRLKSIETAQINHNYLTDFYRQLRTWRQEIASISLMDMQEELIKVSSQGENLQTPKLILSLFIAFKKKLETQILLDWAEYFYGELDSIFEATHLHPLGIFMSFAEAYRFQVKSLFKEQEKLWKIYLEQPKQSLGHYICEQMQGEPLSPLQ
jgi:preprotein translocase subunit SecA